MGKKIFKNIYIKICKFMVWAFTLIFKLEKSFLYTNPMSTYFLKGETPKQFYLVINWGRNIKNAMGGIFFWSPAPFWAAVLLNIVSFLARNYPYSSSFIISTLSIVFVFSLYRQYLDISRHIRWWWFMFEIECCDPGFSRRILYEFYEDTKFETSKLKNGGHKAHIESEFNYFRTIFSLQYMRYCLIFKKNPFDATLYGQIDAKCSKHMFYITLGYYIGQYIIIYLDCKYLCKKFIERLRK